VRCDCGGVNVSITGLVVTSIVVSMRCQTSSQTKVGDLSDQTFTDEHIASRQVTMNNLPHVLYT